ncbi:methionine aminotransferase [Parapedobacter koreensis]|uniref:2-keto-4-methylthiobutyrate aminotransferase apoenzyme n=1 Tax=Parapedobacter koreensis TaxID=332977 RepID=A0A1H7GUZ9_9SPHI|nr:methionine aminotransferase [Parapedobacter koreensis]SEK39695.1 2-keto-4-methylthiobutyrate aminotransferase apoenzyme [Parapedobacter koreensis]
MSAFRSKLPNTAISIFTQMSQLAIQHHAINLSQGFPDFDCSPRLISMVERAMQAGHNQYAPMAGVIALREQISAKVEAVAGIYYHPETEITITAGATQALFTAIATVIHPGDEVILFEPAYDAYAPSVRVFGGIPKPVTLRAPDFAIDWRAVEGLMTPKTRLIIINSPNNPTARVLTDADYEQLARIIRDQHCYVLSDEVYEHIVYDGATHRSAAHHAELREHTFIVASFGKLYHTTGWKVGYCLAPAALMAEFRKVHQFNVFSVNTPVQYALADFLGYRDEYLGLGAFFQQKRNLMLAALAATRFRVLSCQGTYFLLADYSAISDLPEHVFCQELTTQHRVATIPISSFYHKEINQQLVRICFAKQSETLEQAAERLARVSEL